MLYYEIQTDGGRLPVFKTKWFARFARKEGIGDGQRADAVRELEKSLNDGDLGAGLIKKRVALR